MEKKSTKSNADAKKKRITLDIRGKVNLAKTFDVSMTTVDNWIIKGCPAKKVKGVWHFNFKSVDKWLQVREEGLEKADPELTKQRARLVRLQADRKEIELLRTKAELLPVREALAVWSAVMISFKQRLESMENSLPPMLFGLSIPQIKETLSRYITEMRNELSEPDLRALAKKSAATGGK